MSDQDLNPIYAAVQSGHAVAQWLLEHPSQTWNNSYLIYVKATADRLTYLLEKLGGVAFYEPDLDGKMTAVAIECCPANKKFLSRLKHPQVLYDFL